jgi:hypothetical protein
MFGMFLDSAKLFLRGKLFRDNAAVIRMWLVGFVIATALVLLLALYVNVWLGAILGGLCGGALMPYLLRNLKYA